MKNIVTACATVKTKNQEVLFYESLLAYYYSTLNIETEISFS